MKVEGWFISICVDVCATSEAQCAAVEEFLETHRRGTYSAAGLR